MDNVTINIIEEATPVTVTITEDNSPVLVTVSQARGPAGPTGPTGPQGAKGDPGIGVPVGGTTDQILKKLSNNDYDTVWADGGGLGDMTKAVYDPSNNGRVLVADRALNADNAGHATNADHADSVDGVAWSQISNIPDTFTPASHTHLGTDILSAVSNAVDSDTLDGLHANEFSLSTHNHDGVYAPISSVHDPVVVVDSSTIDFSISGQRITGSVNPGGIDAADLQSGTATDGYVLTADGLGGAAWEEAQGGTGSGDMLKADYDTNSDGKVNSADSADVALSVEWNNVAHKPSTFDPSAHTHSGSDILSAVANATNATNATNAFAVPWTGVTDKPTTFPPESHAHSGADITSGIVNSAYLGSETRDGTKFLRDDNTWQTIATTQQHVAMFTFPNTFQVGQASFPHRNLYGKTMLFKKLSIEVLTAPVGQAVIIDILKNGVTIFTNQAHRPQLDSGQSYAVFTTFDVDQFADGDSIQVTIVQVGSSVVGNNLSIQLLYEG